MSFCHYFILTQKRDQKSCGFNCFGSHFVSVGVCPQFDQKNSDDIDKKANINGQNDKHWTRDYEYGFAFAIALPTLLLCEVYHEFQNHRPDADTNGWEYPSDQIEYSKRGIRIALQWRYIEPSVQQKTFNEHPVNSGHRRIDVQRFQTFAQPVLKRGERVPQCQ